MGEVKINEGRLTVRQDLPYTYYFIPQVLLFHRFFYSTGILPVASRYSSKATR